ncbi:Man1-Src1p-C-terminal domain-containing protein [Gigaspora margarita]|uniref:Man1-Src1p-C-terminal domain-containing protein n=1 Tax=Gigaspora margarita TaxID=4874 RepID=A0A8H4A911_GIGMA|nr:Man1-Src1p-C-terminal domain-containing protein [Gigaspora margarita]
MDPYKDYYMDPGFLPQKVTMARLREILGEHSVHYTGSEKKAELVELFNKHILPLVPSLRKKEEELKSYRTRTEAELAKSAERKPKKTRKSSVASSETPQTTPRSSRSSKRTSKGKVKDIVNESEPLSEELTDVDSKTITVRSIVPDITPSKTNDKGRLYPEIPIPKRVKEDHTTNRREAVAYAFRNPNYMPTRQINRQPSPELIKSQTKPRGLKTALLIFFVIFIIGAYARFKMEIGFCDGSSNTTDDESTESENSLFKISCAPCPPKANCSEGKITSCDEGFVFTSSSIHWLKPFTSRCILDFDRVQKIEKYTKMLTKISAEETGKVICGYEDRENLLFQNLQQLLRQKKLPFQDTDENFEKLTQIALKDFLRSDDGLEIVDEREGHNKLRTYVIAKKPSIPLFCRIKLFGIAWIKENLMFAIGTILICAALVGIVYKVREKIWENEQVNKAADIVLNAMRQERNMISAQWQESVMPHIKNDFKRIELWKRVEKCIQGNPMVRTRRFEYKGRNTYTWEWLGETHAIY